MTSATLVLPCLNEEEAVGGCVADALDVFRRAGIDGHVIVVDNGCTDRSAEVAAAAGATVLYQAEPGYGAALRTGFAAAHTDIVLMADADATYEFAAIPRLIEPIVAGRADLVLGARLASASSETMPFLHRFVGTPIISILVNRAAGGLNIKDSQSGFRAFRRDAIMNLGLAGTGMEFASEMLVRAGWAKLRIAEVDTVYSERIGESKLETFPDGIRHLRQLLLLSPDVFGVIPGIVLSVASVVTWLVLALESTHVAKVGSVGWACSLIAGVASVIGPIIYTSGMLLRYRAVALGLRHKEGSISLETLIRRLSITGFLLLIAILTLVSLLIINYHSRPHFFGTNVQVVLGSMMRSGVTIGVMLAALPLLSPFVTRRPMLRLPEAIVEYEEGSSD